MPFFSRRAHVTAGTCLFATAGAAIFLPAPAGAQVGSDAPLSIAIPREGSPVILPKVIKALSVTTITVNAEANRVGINPNIYGVSNLYTGGGTDLPTASDASSMNTSAVRKGGNLDSTYNWMLDSFNHGLDYYFESSPDAGGNGSVADSFVTRIQTGGGKPMLTIPMINYVATNGWSFSVSKYGYTPHSPSAYYDGSPTDPYNSDAGSGVIGYNSNTNANLYFTGNDPTDANTANSVAFQKSWVQHLIAMHNSAANGGVPYFILDNEPDDWHDEHADGNPVGVTLNGLSSVGVSPSTGLESRLESYSQMVKSIDPTALTVGPEIGGAVWYGYFLSGYDLYRYNQFSDSSDAEFKTYSKGGILPQLLSDLSAYDASHGSRTLDVCSVHYYPQDGEYSDDDSSGTQLLRNKSTRALWDTTYVDPAFSGSGLSDGAGDSVVQLLPALRGWIAKNYPGLQTGLTEYSWGADGYMNGATAQADILGIMGRAVTVNGFSYPGLDLATRFTSPASGTPVFQSYQMFRNVDGSDNGFGTTSISCATDGATNADNLAAFAAVTPTTFTGNYLTVMVVNKRLTSDSSGTTTLTVNFTLQNGMTVDQGVAQVYRLAAKGTNPAKAAITHLANTAAASGSLSATVPLQSVTLFRIHAALGFPYALHVKLGLPSAFRFSTGGGMASKAVAVKFLQPGTTTVIDQKSLYPDADGNLYLGTSLAGVYDVAIKPQGCLQHIYRNVTVGASAPQIELGTMAMYLGDVNNDNSIDLTDYSPVLAAYGKTYLDAGFNSAYDIDGDGAITASDLAIIKANFRMKGDK